MGPSNPNYNISQLEQDLLPLRLSLQPGLSKDSNKTKSVFGYSQITIGVVNSIHISFYWVQKESSVTMTIMQHNDKKCRRTIIGYRNSKLDKQMPANKFQSRKKLK